MKELRCSIVNFHSFPYSEYDDYYYVVKDGDECVATGVSSSLFFVRHDAGGYHTKAKFDKLYPDGWVVLFDF